jgi:hypothetical protein
MMTIRERYLNDAKFHHVVDMLQAMIDAAEFTPTEIREAAMLAQIMYEERRPSRPITFSREDVLRGKV